MTNKIPYALDPRKEKKREVFIKLLESYNLEIIKSNFDVMFQVFIDKEYESIRIDIWPTTGKWKCQATGDSGEDALTLKKFLDEMKV